MTADGQEDFSSNQRRKSKAAVRAAWIAGVAAVIVAVIGFGGHLVDRNGSGGGVTVSGKGNNNTAPSQTGSGQQTTSQGAPAVSGAGNVTSSGANSPNVVGSNNSVISGSNNTIGVLDSEFHRQNGMQFQQSPGLATFSQPSKTGNVSFNAFNRSTRVIEHAQLLMYNRSSKPGSLPMGATEDETLVQGARLGLQFPLVSAPPKSVLVCLTFESDKPGIFITAVGELTLEKQPFPGTNQTFSYKAKTEYSAFYSSKHADCNRSAEIAKIPNEQFFATH